MDLREFTFADLPFAPGESPYRMKGVAFRETIELFDKQPSGFERVKAALPTAELRRFFEQPFTPAGWYDVFAMAQLDMAAARAFRLSYDQWLRDSTRAQAQSVLHGIYRSFARMMAPSTIAWALPRVSATYFDFGKLTTHRSSPQSVTATFEDVPMLLAGWFSVVTGEFALEALKIAGTPQARLQWAPLTPRGARAGVALARLEFRFEWS